VLHSQRQRVTEISVNQRVTEISVNHLMEWARSKVHGLNSASSYEHAAHDAVITVRQTYKSTSIKLKL